MMADWFRSWHGAPTDPKWRTVAKRAKVAPSLVVAVAWALMDRASQNSERGSIDGLDIETLADFMDCEVDEIERVMVAMREKCVLTDSMFTAWEKRQPIREDGSAERARLWREQKRLEKEEAERKRAPEDEHKRVETQPNANEHRCRADADADSEKIAAAAAARDVDPKRRLEDDCRRLVGEEPCLVDPDFSPMLRLLDEGLTEEDVRIGISEGLQKSRPGYRFRSWQNFDKWVRTTAKNRLAGKPRSPTPPPNGHKQDPPNEPRIPFGGGVNWPESTVRQALQRWKSDPSTWPDLIGEPPGRPGCRVPKHLLEEIAA